jgi:hypothetical protein
VDLIKNDKIKEWKLSDHSICGSVQNTKALSAINVTGFAYPARLYDSYGLWI